MKRYKYYLVAVVFVLALFGLRDKVNAQLGYGGKIFYQGGEVTITSLGGDAGGTSWLRLYSPYVKTDFGISNKNFASWTGVLTGANPGDALVFEILPEHGIPLRMGYDQPAGQFNPGDPMCPNPLSYGVVECGCGDCSCIEVRFEDLPWHYWESEGEYPGDYNDLRFRFQGAVSLEPGNNPIGNHDGPQGCSTVWGWACDADSYGSTLQVQIYRDGPKGGGGVYLGTVRANISRPGLEGSCGGTNNHGFSYTIPSSLKDGSNHSYYTYAINTGGGSDVLLPSSPRSVTCAPPCVPNEYCITDGDGGWTGAVGDYNNCGKTPTLNCTPRNNATCRSVSGLPSEMLVSETRGVIVTMNNPSTATKTWKQSTNHNLASRNGLFYSSSISLPDSAFGPGSSVPFSFNATSPASAGNYTFNFGMRESSTNFGSTCPRSVTVYQPLPYPAGDCSPRYQLAVYDEETYKTDPAGSLLDSTAFQSSNIIRWRPSVSNPRTNIIGLNGKQLRYEITLCYDSFKCNKIVSDECVEWVIDKEVCTLAGKAIKKINCPVPELLSFSPGEVELESVDNNTPAVDVPEEQKSVDVTIKCTDDTLLSIVTANSDINDIAWDYNDLSVCSTGFDISPADADTFDVTAGLTVLGVCEDVAIATLANFTYGGFDWGQIQGRLNVRIVGGQSVAEEFIYSGDLLSDPPPGFEKLYLPELVD